MREFPSSAFKLVALVHYKTIIHSGSELKIFQLFDVLNWEAMLSLMSKAILEMHQTLLKLVKMARGSC